ncbi:DNA mismatch repair protein Msh3 [Verticillium alfalfae VaMs.102]|uniref:MutS protein homolog 3 n=1 Tax=Verticillium alfalfae (strain VaMs.102 / ATCC MYA-4576 / FGSC 10136) TaxID=526221 RepID=C9SI06_VERA1|nr:DNA mismatch repair protein Msh3 [Verticillium alfalfae VaMs.102]EEY18579.1 DNA mismatch repair protein Msh3 [Verticillium alfalfae VaMs.102]
MPASRMLLMSRSTESIGNFMVDAQAPLHLLYKRDKLYGRQSALMLVMDQVPRRMTATARLRSLWYRQMEASRRHYCEVRTRPERSKWSVHRKYLRTPGDPGTSQRVHDPETRLDFDITTFPDSCRPSPFNSIPASKLPNPIMAPAEKKQKSLTSFFQPRPASSPVAASQKPTTQSPSPSRAETNKTKPVETSRKRPLEEDADRVNNGSNRTLKRRKADISEEAEGEVAPSPSSPLGSKARPSAPKPSSRTERFLCMEPSSDAAVPLKKDDEEEEDAEMAQKTERRSSQTFRQETWPPRQHAASRGPATEEATQGAEDEDGEDGDEEEAPPPPKGAKKGGARANKKLTPMEIQFLDIKRKHMDTVLIVEVGYKFRFFGEDARIAARELSIVCIPGKFRYDEHPSESHLDRFASASIPVHRLPVHAKRLVAAGHKVGVVRQLETAALKKAGDNRNAPFVRKLTNVYTKGTYIDENGELDSQGENGAPAAGYLLCITETPSKGQGTDEKVDVGIVAVQPATGDIIYDNFEDGFMRSEIETRLLHISPCEFVIVGDLTKGTDKMIRHLSGSSTNVFGDRSRFYADKMKDTAAESAANGTAVLLLDKVLHLPEAVTICLSAMITHLKEYGLEHIFDLTKYFQSFTTRQHMLINGSTLESLEVYRNSTDHTEHGSLFWALDKTSTRFGQRLLRKWVGRPLLDDSQLEERVAAVEEIANGQGTPQVDKLEALLVSIKTDLERSLIRMYYAKCSRPELLAVLQSLQRIATQYATIKTASDIGFDSPLIANALLSLPHILDTIISYLDKINPEAARKDDKYNFFREAEQNEDIQDFKMGIVAVEQELDEHRRDAAAKLGRKKPVDYVTNLARMADPTGEGPIRNVHMRFTATRPDGREAPDNGAGADSEGDDDVDAAAAADEEITFLYEVAEGVAHRSYGLNVARLARIPRKVINVAARKSRELERDMRHTQIAGSWSSLV